MADHVITLTEEQEAAFSARVAWLEAQSEISPPVFPPVTPVADVDALVVSFFDPIIAMVEQWYLAQ